VQAAAFFRKDAQGVTLFVRLTPKSSRDCLEGPELAADGRCHLKARVRAVPENGKANDALIRLLAKELAIAPREISVISGMTSRLKQIRLQGEPGELEQKLLLLV
jgi:uncharacterized protein